MAAAIELEHARKTFRDTVAVHDLSLSIADGELCGFIGPNGSGKTSTLRMIMRIYAPDSGRVSVLGRDHHGPADDRVGYLPEERMLYRTMKVGEVLRYFSQLKGHTPGRHEIEDWLEKLGLPGVAKRRVHTLSKGQTQKIQLIAVLIAKPQLVLLDEPFSGLDPVNSQVVRDAIVGLQQQGVTVLFSTHDMPVAEEMCRRVVMIHRGHKVLDGTIESIRYQFGAKGLHVRLAGGAAVPALDGVASVARHGGYDEVLLKPDTDPQAVLRQLQNHGPVELFEIARPTLQDIFLRLAGDGAKPQAAADGGGT